MPPLFAERFFDAGQKAFVICVRDSCRISFCPVKYPVGDVPENRPDGILSGCAVILAEEAILSGQKSLGIFQRERVITGLKSLQEGLVSFLGLPVICAVVLIGFCVRQMEPVCGAYESLLFFRNQQIHSKRSAFDQCNGTILVCH